MNKKDEGVTPEQEVKENRDVALAEVEGDQPTPTPTPEPPKPDPKAEDKPKKPERWQDPTRQAIYSKARRKRESDKPKDFESLDEPGKARAVRMEMEMANASEEDIQARLTELGLSEADPEPPPEPKPEPEPKPDAEPDKKPAEGVDKDRKTVTIRVDGEDIDVEVDKVLEAGKATLQKERNADRRQQELSQYEKSLREYERRVRENAARGLDANGNPLTPAKADLPDKGVGEAMEKIKEKAAAVRAAIFSGEEDKVEEALTDLLTSVAQGRQGPTPPLETLVEEAANLVETRQEGKKRTDTAQTVNETFEHDFADLYEDDQKFSLTKAEFDRLRAAEPNADPVAHMRSAGETIRKLFKQDSNVEDELERRRELKGRLPPPPSAQGRAPKPEAPRPKSRSEAVQEMRRKRGLQ